jgi:RNA polymerase sigma-70 factor (ECF subfamily)
LIRLADQDRTQWDRALISEGQELVRTCLRRNRPGPFQIQAAISAVHADATTSQSTDWSQVIILYDHLYEMRPNPVVALNRSVAVAELHGPADNYQPYHAARADFLTRVGRLDEAAAAYDRAIELTSNTVERDFLTRQRAAN